MKKSIVLILIILCIKLVSFGQQGWVTYDKLNINYRTCNAIDKFGNIWIGTFYNGVYKFDGNNLINYNTLNSGIKSNCVLSIAIDSIGNKWFSTQGDTLGFATGVISKFDDSKWLNFDSYSYKQKTYYFFSTPISKVDSKGNLIISVKINGDNGITSGGLLLKFNGNSFDPYLIYCDPPNQFIFFKELKKYDIDKNGVVWSSEYFSTKPSYRLVNYKCSSNDTISLSFRPRNIKIDRNDNKWMGTYNGLFKYDGTNWINFNTKNSGIVDDTINTFEFDSKNNLWVGTNHGLSKFDGTNWITYTIANSSLNSNYINQISIDKKDIKWIDAGEFLTKFDDSFLVARLDKQIINNFNIYPNPTNDILHIDNGNYLSMDGYSIKIISLTGAVIYNQPIVSQKVQISMNQLATKGLYLAQMLDSNNAIVDSKKIVLE